jgi:hypothetical protein
MVGSPMEDAEEDWGDGGGLGGAGGGLGDAAAMVEALALADGEEDRRLRDTRLSRAVLPKVAGPRLRSS